MRATDISHRSPRSLSRSRGLLAGARGVRTMAWAGLTAFALASAGLPATGRAHELPATASAPAHAPAGIVAFANTGAAAAQADFLYGLAQLHNFEYGTAAEAFRRAQQADPTFVMAYWGEAMTANHPLWAWQDAPAARAVLARLAPTREARAALARDPRERAYLEAIEGLYGDGEKFDRDVRYARAMQALHERFPSDVDATCFHALSLMGTSHEGRDVPTYMKAAALMIEAHHAYPQHPGAAHYLIHAVDDPVHAPLGLEAARAYSRIAPAAGHAQHMTSHIFTALGLWPDVIESNENAARVVADERRAQGKAAPSCYHYTFFLQYGYLQAGRGPDARRVFDACAAEARGDSPRIRDGDAVLDVEGSAPALFYGMRARQVLDSSAWDPAVASATVDTHHVAAAEFERDWLDAYLVLRGRQPGVAADVLARAEASAAVLSAAMDAAKWGPSQPGRVAVGIRVAELRGLSQWQAGHRDEALATLARAAADEKAMPYEFGPPVVTKPSFELLGEMLLEAGRTAPACAAFDDALRLAPNRRASLDGLRACGRAGA